METFGQLVIRLREERKLTQAKLALRAECDNDTIARVEQGRGTWFRRTAYAVYAALSEVQPLSIEDATAYFKLSKYKPAEEKIERDIAEGRIHVGDPIPAALAPPADIIELISKMLFSFGEARVRALLRAALAFAIDAESTSKEGGVAAVAIDFEDPESGLRGKMYTPARPSAAKPSETRRKKPG